MSIDLQNEQAFRLLNTWANKNNENKIPIEFSKEIGIGNGNSKFSNRKLQCIEIGIYPLTGSISDRDKIMKDSDFVTIGITMFHEIAHYDQKLSLNISKEILISELSKFGNSQYYHDNWHKLAHEIDAEYTGIITMWEHLDSIYPDDADIFMLDRLADRTMPDKTPYIIQKPENGFQSKEQIEELFEKAYDESLISKRELTPKFLRSGDEIAQLFTYNGSGIRIEYYPFYHQLQTARGLDADTKMASLVTYIHPELQNEYPELNFAEFDPLLVFGIPMPETREEILNRIELQFDDKMLSKDSDNSQDFADAVANIPVSNNPLEQ